MPFYFAALVAELFLLTTQVASSKHHSGEASPTDHISGHQAADSRHRGHPLTLLGDSHMRRVAEPWSRRLNATRTECLHLQSLQKE